MEDEPSPDEGDYEEEARNPEVHNIGYPTGCEYSIIIEECKGIIVQSFQCNR